MTLDELSIWAEFRIRELEEGILLNRDQTFQSYQDLANRVRTLEQEVDYLKRQIQVLHNSPLRTGGGY